MQTQFYPATMQQQSAAQQQASLDDKGPFTFFIPQAGNKGKTASDIVRNETASVIDKINEYSSRKGGVTVKLSALGHAIELCFRIANEVQSKF